MRTRRTILQDISGCLLIGGAGSVLTSCGGGGGDIKKSDSFSLFTNLSVNYQSNYLSDIYLGQIILSAASYVPDRAIECKGQQLPINQYAALYALLGNFYNGSGDRYFSVPNLIPQPSLLSSGLIKFLIPFTGIYPSLEPKLSDGLGFTGEVGIFPYHTQRLTDIPQGWSKCDGSTLTLSSATKLFQAIGNKFGGDGVLNFSLPNMVTSDLVTNQKNLTLAICADGTDPSLVNVSSGLVSYIGQIKIFASQIIPQGFLPCDGRLLPIANNELLFNVLRTNFGGNGIANFALPLIPNLLDGKVVFAISTTGLFPPIPI